MPLTNREMLQTRPTPEHPDPPTTPSVLEPRDRGPAHEIGARFNGRPKLASVVAAIGGFVLLAAIMIGLGTLLTQVLIPHGVGSWDNNVNEWFASRRTPALNTVTLWGSSLAMTPTVIGVGLLAVIVLAIARRWREVTFLVIGLAVEASAFLVTTLVVQRPRPTVQKLDPAPATSSFPSGHVAAGIALYVGLAILLSSHLRSLALRALIWMVALALPIAIAISRVYRGEHHPTDVIASLLILGPGALLVATLAARSASAAAPSEEIVPADRREEPTDRKVA